MIVVEKKIRNMNKLKEEYSKNSTVCGIYRLHIHPLFWAIQLHG
jgi:hypothetical protein